MKPTFFELIYPEIDFNLEGFTQVVCPFPHGENDGVPYYETNPSAGINVMDKGFHCFSCHRKHSEVSFIQEYMGITIHEAHKLRSILDSAHNSLDEFKDLFIIDEPNTLKMAEELGFSNQTLDLLGIQTEQGRLVYPVSIFGRVVDTVRYSNKLVPKVLRNKGSKSGMIIPYDIWKSTLENKATVICAGEKDMTIAREYGLNAITITGGEGALPELFRKDFVDKDVFIIYDNDLAGRNGANKVASFLKPLTKSVRVVDLSSVTTEEGEDLWDFFKKYNKTRQDLIQIMRETPEFSKENMEKIIETQYPTMTIKDALSPENVGKLVRSNVQIVVSYDDQFQVPSLFTGTKTGVTEAPSKNLMLKGETRNWYLDKYNMEDILHLVDSNLKEGAIHKNKLDLLGISDQEANVLIQDGSNSVVYKSVVVDYNKASGLSEKPVEMIAFSIDKPMYSGHKYKITYKLVPHPYDGQKLVMMIVDLEGAEDSITNFQVTEPVKEILKEFQVVDTLKNRIDHNLNQFYGVVGHAYNPLLVMVNELTFHSTLEFDFNRWHNNIGALDIMVIGESRTGKSDTAETLSRMYGVGTKVDMINTTKAGLIGGSNSSGKGGGYQTRAGVLPMNHGNLVILEEFGKARENNIIDLLTEVKSSGVARITRVNGQLDLPSVNRRIAITNPKTTGSTSKPIASYPNGIEIITDLLGKAENIARFDAIAIFADMGDGDIDLDEEFGTPYPENYYTTKINWAWSRTKDQIVISKDVESHTISVSNKLRKQYNTHIKIFGTETWKKLMRFAIALAMYVVSTDETFETVIVKKEHIDYVAQMLTDLYDNETFKLAEYVEAERRLREIDDEGIYILQQLFNKNSVLLLELEQNSETTRANLEIVSGYDRAEFTTFIHEMVRRDFVIIRAHSIMPTERFRRGMKQVDRTPRVEIGGAITL